MLREFVLCSPRACSLFCFRVCFPFCFLPLLSIPPPSFAKQPGEVRFCFVFCFLFCFQFDNAQTSGLPRSQVSALPLLHIPMFPHCDIPGFLDSHPHPPSDAGAELCQIACGPAGGESRRRRDSVFNVGQNAPGPVSAGRRRAPSVCLGAGLAGRICFLFPLHVFFILFTGHA